ncbi:MAG: ZIP family metal transporter [Chloroflexota bacterium]
MESNISVWTVFIAASITALCTGLGALPFFFVKEINKQWLGIGNSVAAGLMLGASMGLVWEGAQMSIPRLLVGIVLGLLLIIGARKLLEGREEVSLGELDGADAVKILLILGVMTAHSFAEGIGVGVSWGGGEAFGSLINIAIAVHNIPEGLAISLVMIPRGTSVLKASGWSIFSSLPQPLMAVPAFLFVLVFEPFLPVGLGLAAGAMFWMVATELMPEALEDVRNSTAYSAMATSVVLMLAFQAVIG